MKTPFTFANVFVLVLISIVPTGCNSEKKFEGDGFSISLIDGFSPAVFSNQPEANSWTNNDQTEVFTLATTDPFEDESEKLEYIESQFIKVKKEAGYEIDLETPPSLTTPVAEKESFSIVSGGYTLKCTMAFLPKRTYFLTVATISPNRTEELSKIINTLEEH